jgi:hypothetical protein
LKKTATFLCCHEHHKKRLVAEFLGEDRKAERDEDATSQPPGTLGFGVLLSIGHEIASSGVAGP